MVAVCISFKVGCAPIRPLPAVYSSRGHCQVRRFRAARSTKLHASSAAAKNLQDADWDNVDWDEYDWRDYVDDAPGPAFLDTLHALEWATVCKHISSFTSTYVGKKRCLNIEVARTLERALILQRETKAVSVLELYLNTSLDFGGIHTDAAETALRRANKGGMLTGDLCLGVASLINGTQNIQSTLRAARNTAQGSLHLARIEVLTTRFLGQELHLDVVKAVDSAVTETGTVRDSASEAVKRTRALVATLEGRLRGILAKYSSGEVSTYRGRMCVAVSTGESKGSGIVLGSGVGVQYVEPGAALQPNNDLTAARAQAMAAEEAVLWQLTGLVVDRYEELAALLDSVVWLDVVAARHRYTEWMEGAHVEFGTFPWERPRGDAAAEVPASVAAAAAAAETRAADRGGRRDGDSDMEVGGETGQWGAACREMDESAWIHLKRLRHPLLHGWYLEQTALWKRQSKQKKPKGQKVHTATAVVCKPQPVVPINFVVGKDVRSVIITGPNTGGKTASLKALGLSVLLAMCGCGVPAREPARLPPFSAVLADIGDSQELSASLSTFSGHLRRISALRAEATDGRALVLLDEVGTGTDPQEGAALGAALLERLAGGGAGGAALTVATTHMSALTGLKFDDPRFENASAEFDEATLAPTYRLLWGVPGRSNALSIAARLGVPQDVVEEARDIWGSSQARMDSLINELEGLRGDVEHSEAALDAAVARLRTLEAEEAAAVAEAAALRAELDVTRAAIVGSAVEASLRRLRRQLRLQEREAKEAAEVQAEVQRVSKQKKRGTQQDARKLQAQAQSKWLPAVGDLVEVPKLGGAARVSEVKGKKVTVAFGQMPVTLNVSEVIQM